MKRRKAIKYSLAGFAQVGLLGGVLTWSQSCAPPPAENYIPQVLSPSEMEILGIISDIILPPTDTPGAVDVGVPAAIDHFLKGFMVPSNQDQVKKGLNTLNALCLQLVKKDIKNASQPEQEQVVAYLSKDAERSSDKSNHFFYVIRGLIVSAYFQSEEVSKTVLNYDPTPGQLDGAYPLSKVKSNWTFNT